jgi:hypothetical protein
MVLAFTKLNCERGATLAWKDPVTLLTFTRTFPVYKILREGTDDPLLQEWGVPPGIARPQETLEEFNQRLCEQREKDAK